VEWKTKLTILAEKTGVGKETPLHPLYPTINHRPVTLGGCRNIFVINVWNLVAVVIFGKDEDGVGVRNGVDFLLDPSL